MSRILGRDQWVLLLIFPLVALFAAVVFSVVYPLHFSVQPLFISDLLGFSIGLPNWLIFLFGFFDLLLVWLLSRIFFQKNFSFLYTLFFGLSPWFIYTVALGSFYIYILGVSLVIFLATYLISKGEYGLGGILFIVFSLVLLYSSIIFLPVYILFIIGIIIFGFIPFSKLKLDIIFVFILCLPLFFFAFKNSIGFRNILNNQVNFLSDPGLINSLNVYQGESKRSGFSYLSKISENKYIYIARFVSLKFMQNLVPSTLFTPEEKLLGFSFAPPLYIGMLVPFLYGIYLIMKSRNLRKYLILSLILVIPSLLSKQLVDLNRLILLEPVIIFIIIYGSKNLVESKKKRIVFFFCLALILLQLVVTIMDIRIREYPRFEHYFGIRHWEVNGQ